MHGGIVRTRSRRGLGGEDLVQHGLGLVLIRVFGERQFADQDLTGLREHSLLAGRQASVLIATPEISDDLGDLDHVTGCQFLQVRLVATRPVGRLFRVGLPQHLEHSVETLLIHDIANTHEVNVRGWHPDCQVSLGDPEYQVLPGFSLDDSGLD